MANIEINTRQLNRLLKKLLPSNHTCLITGGPGIGKSLVVKDTTKEINNEFLPPLYPGCLQDVEVPGLPVPVENNSRLKRLMDELLAPAFMATKPSTLFIDEFDIKERNLYKLR